MDKYIVDDQHAASNVPEGRKWKLVWSDEFDGDTLDTSKWGFRMGLFHTRHNTFTDEGVSVSDGCLHINLVEKDGQYYSAQLQTGANYMDNPPPERNYGKFSWPIAPFQKQRFLHKYGYYECRCKTQTQPGWWSAFWLQSPIIGCIDDPAKAGVEIDILESFEPGLMIPHYIHWDGYGADHKHAFACAEHERVLKDRYRIPESEDGWHTFGLLWDKNGYTFYVDGQFDGHLDGPVSDTEQFILLSTECQGYRRGEEPSDELKTAVLPDEFTVDYIRVFDEVEE